MGQQLFEILMYFIIYSILGWIMESIIRSIIEKKIINTGFLKGPFCPIYGIGAIIMILFLERFQDNIIALFFISIIVLTSWEYFVGILLEKIFNTKYWDYSHQKFNFQGRICLTNSLFWGVLGVVFIKYIHPFIVSIILKADINLLYYIVGILSFIMIVDFISTIIKVKNIKLTLEKADKINKEIKEKLKELRKINKDLKDEKDETKSKTKENMQKMVEQLKKKRNRMILKLYKNVYRLKRAFPAINTKEITEVLSKKIEVKKNNNNKKNKNT